MHKSRPKWLPIEGSPEIVDGTITFIGVKKPAAKKSTKTDEEEDAPKANPMATVKADTYFESGDITGEVRLSTTEVKIFFRLGAVGSDRTSVGFGVNGHTYGLSSLIENKLTDISHVGADTSIPANQWLRFRIRVRGSKIEFFVEDIQVLHGVSKFPRAQLVVKFVGEGTAELKNVAVEAIRPQAFVVMQFTNEYTALFKEVIEPVCTDFGYQVVRGDNVYTNGLIIEDIVRSIRECSVVIADITPNNANVYYELGFAHGIGKPAILLSDRSRDKLPFDISGFRLLFYDNTIGGKKAVEEALQKHLEAIREA